MVKTLASPIGMTAIFLIIIGLVMAVVGIILLIANQNSPKPWYIWFLLISGAVLGIIGGIILAVWFSSYEDKNCDNQNLKCPEYKMESSFEQVNLQTKPNIPINVAKIDVPQNNIVNVESQQDTDDLDL
jgi:flagellar basal body-associated protein FliL